MNHYKLTMEFQSYWLVGSGSSHLDADLSPVTETCGLPYFPGKTLNGLLKDALSFEAPNRLKNLFGEEGGDRGTLIVDSAHLPGTDAFAAKARHHYAEKNQVMPEVEGLFTFIASTALENGVAKKHSLRKFRVAIPMTLEADLSCPDEIEDDLKAAAGLIGMCGVNRNSGLGEVICEVRPTGNDQSGGETSKGKDQETTEWVELPYEMTLKQPVILTRQGATEGGHETLDFIPGSVLLGAAAGRLYPKLKSENKRELADEIFLGGGVHFSSALPMIGGQAAIPVPASWHTKKDDDSGQLFNLAQINEKEVGGQPVQCRHGFCQVDDSGKGTFATPAQGLTIKSARDRSKRGVSAEGQLFSYAYLEAGQKFAGVIHARGDLVDLIKATLSEKGISIGRSSRSEFGGVEIIFGKTIKVTSEEKLTGAPVGLALSDLALVDDLNQPVFTPKPSHFDLKDEEWEIDQAKSFLLFRSYWPWNAKRQAPDLERHVITAGSVIAFQRKEVQDDKGDLSLPTRKGLYQNEGLGRIAWNHPAISQAEFSRENGSVDVEKPTGADGKIDDHPAKKRYDDMQNRRKVRFAAEELEGIWRNFPSPSASQWSQLDRIAFEAKTPEDAVREFERFTKDGAAKRKWKQGLISKVAGFADVEAVKGLSDDSLKLRCLIQATRIARRSQTTQEKQPTTQDA